MSKHTDKHQFKDFFVILECRRDYRLDYPVVMCLNR